MKTKKNSKGGYGVCAAALLLGGKIKNNRKTKKNKIKGGGGIFSKPNHEKNKQKINDDNDDDSIVPTVKFHSTVRKRKSPDDLYDNTSDNSEEGDLSGTFKKKKKNTKNRFKSARSTKIKSANKNILTGLDRKTEKAHNENNDNFMIKNKIDRNEWERRKKEINNRRFIGGRKTRKNKKSKK